MIRAVFFDFYGTLAGWQPAAEQIQREACAAEGVGADPARVRRAYPAANAFLDAENAKRPMQARSAADREAILGEFEHRLLAAAGVVVPHATAARIWARVAATPKHLALYPDSLSAVRGLHGLGLTIGVISNLGPELHRLVPDLGLGPFVQVRVSGQEMGLTKPHPAIFHAALANAGVTAAEAVHVGDGYDADVLGARAAGLRAIFVDRDGAPHPGPLPPDVATVTSLTEVLPCLRRQRLVA